MFMVKVLPGRRSAQPQNAGEDPRLPDRHHYRPGPGVLVAFNAEQVLPMYIVHYE